MGTPIVNLDTLIDTRVSANLDVQTTLEAKQDVLDAVVDAQAILDSVDTTVLAKKIELNQHTAVKKIELDTHVDSLESGLDVYGDGKVDEYDANTLNRVTQYNDNHTDKLTIYNSNDAIKMSQYNANHIDRLEDINYAYADRIVQMLKTKRIYGMIDQYIAQTEVHMIPFLSTDDANYIYYGNGTLLELGVDYTIYDTTTIELVVKANPYDVITQINTQVLNDMLTAEGALFEERIGAANGVAGLDTNGLIPSSQLPSYVDDVLEYATYADLPVTGEEGKIYVVIADETSVGDTSSYRWTGSVYAMVSNTLTAADVKSLYESNVDTNAYTDAEKLKLAAVDQEVAIGSDVEFNSVKFTGGTGTEGTVSWNSTEQTLDIAQDGTTLQVGQELQYIVRNDSGSTIANGTFVGFAGVTSDSNRIIAAPFNTSTMTAMKLIGFATEDIANGVNGRVTNFGYVRGLDTRGTAATGMSVGDEDWSKGDILYVHPTAAGKLTKVAPTSGIKAPVATVTNRHQTLGELFVNVIAVDQLKVDHGEAAYNRTTNIDNTSDVNKPVSTAQQTALNLKANLASPSLMGVPLAPTAAVGTSTTQLATTAFVVNEVNKITEW